MVVLVLGILALTAASAWASDPIAGCATEAGYFMQDANTFPLTMAAVGLIVIDDRVAR